MHKLKSQYNWEGHACVHSGTCFKYKHIYTFVQNVRKRYSRTLQRWIINFAKQQCRLLSCKIQNTRTAIWKKKRSSNLKWINANWYRRLTGSFSFLFQFTCKVPCLWAVQANGVRLLLVYLQQIRYFNEVAGENGDGRRRQKMAFKTELN